MKKTKLKAVYVRNILSLLVVALLLLTAAVFYLFQNYLTEYASSSSDSTVSTNISKTKADLQTQINSLRVIADKAQLLTSSTQDYQRIVFEDIDKYASQSDISVTQKTIDTTNTELSATGLTTMGVTITIDNPVKLDRLVKFLGLIETNLPKIQPTSLSISPASASGDIVNVEPIKTEVYIK